MNALAIRLIAAATAALTLTAGVLYVRALHAELDTEKQAVKDARQGNSDRDATINELRDSVRTSELAMAKLEGERNGIRTLAAEREQTFRRLLDENKEIRDWAAAAVPVPVIRLREHGHLTGAKAYREAAAGRDALHPAGRVDQEQR